MNAVRYGHQQIFPSKVVCIGRNYVEHIEELGNEIPAGMVVFNKPNSAPISVDFTVSGRKAGLLIVLLAVKPGNEP